MFFEGADVLIDLLNVGEFFSALNRVIYGAAHILTARWQLQAKGGSVSAVIYLYAG